MTPLPVHSGTNDGTRIGDEMMHSHDTLECSRCTHERAEHDGPCRTDEFRYGRWSKCACDGFEPLDVARARPRPEPQPQR